MKRNVVFSPDDDPDRTDKLPVLDPEFAGAAARDEMPVADGGRAAVAPDVSGLQHELERRSEAIADLSSALSEKTIALASAEKQLEQVQAELARVRQAAGREANDLQERLHDVESRRVDISVQHDEHRAAIVRLEDQLAEAREREWQLELRVSELVAASETAAMQGLQPAGPAEGNARQPTATEEIGPDMERRPSREQLEELQSALHEARSEASSSASRYEAMKAELDRQAEELSELKQGVAARDNRIEGLLEQLRSREARRRFAADIRRSATPAGPGLPPQRLTALQQELVAERERRMQAESQLQKPGNGADRPATTGEQDEKMRTRVADLSNDIASRDDRIESLEAEIRRIGAMLETNRGRAGAGTRVGSDEHDETAVQRYLTRIDKGAGEVYELCGTRVTIGRTPDSDLQVRESYIGRHHAVIRLGPNSAIIEDLDSCNGVYVNDRRVSREVLRDGDIVLLGKARFRFDTRAAE
jgi:DNA repair exonuclease SbcCD ATPase subunit